MAMGSEMLAEDMEMLKLGRVLKRALDEKRLGAMLSRLMNPLGTCTMRMQSRSWQGTSRTGIGMMAGMEMVGMEVGVKTTGIGTPTHGVKRVGELEGEAMFPELKRPLWSETESGMKIVPTPVLARAALGAMMELRMMEDVLLGTAPTRSWWCRSSRVKEARQSLEDRLEAIFGRWRHG